MYKGEIWVHRVQHPGADFLGYGVIHLGLYVLLFQMGFPGGFVGLIWGLWGFYGFMRGLQGLSNCRGAGLQARLKLHNV